VLTKLPLIIFWKVAGVILGWCVSAKTALGLWASSLPVVHLVALSASSAAGFAAGVLTYSSFAGTWWVSWWLSTWKLGAEARDRGLVDARGVVDSAHRLVTEGGDVLTPNLEHRLSMVCCGPTGIKPYLWVIPPLSIAEVWITFAILVSTSALFLVAFGVWVVDSYRLRSPATPTAVVASMRTRRGPAMAWGAAANLFPGLVLGIVSSWWALPLSIA
jgi:hypothetical protein